jgi:hypothetical protein
VRSSAETILTDKKENRTMKKAPATDKMAAAHAALAAKRARAKAEAAKAAKATDAKVKAVRPNWNEAAAPNERLAKYREDGREWTDFSGEDRLHIEQDIIDSLARDGLVVQWVSESCLGQQMDYHVSQHTRNGWQVLDPDDAKALGILATEIGGLRLYVRDARTHAKALSAEKRKAAEAVLTKQAGLLSGDIPAFALIPNIRAPSEVTK